MTITLTISFDTIVRTIKATPESTFTSDLPAFDDFLPNFDGSFVDVLEDLVCVCLVSSFAED